MSTCCFSRKRLHQSRHCWETLLSSFVKLLESREACGSQFLPIEPCYHTHQVNGSGNAKMLQVRFSQANYVALPLKDTMQMSLHKLITSPNVRMNPSLSITDSLDSHNLQLFDNCKFVFKTIDFTIKVSYTILHKHYGLTYFSSVFCIVISSTLVFAPLSSVMRFCEQLALRTGSKEECPQPVVVVEYDNYWLRTSKVSLF